MSLICRCNLFSCYNLADYFFYLCHSDYWPAVEENLIEIANQHVPGRYQDITDGHVHRSELPMNLDANGTVVLTLGWDIDGSAAVKFKDLKLWPIPAIVIEIPKGLRYSIYSVLFCGLWHGKKKPDFALFQKHFVDQVKVLMKEFTIDLPENNTLKCKLRIQAELADLPVKAASTNCKQYNGKFGCSVCLDPGEVDEDNQLVRYYPYRLQKAPIRNHTDSVQHARLAYNQRSMFGIKWPSPVHSILTIPDKILLDYLHQVLEGQYLRKLKTWFVTSQRYHDYCLKDVASELDKLY